MATLKKFYNIFLHGNIWTKQWHICVLIIHICNIIIYSINNIIMLVLIQRIVFWKNTHIHIITSPVYKMPIFNHGCRRWRSVRVGEILRFRRFYEVQDSITELNKYIYLYMCAMKWKKNSFFHIKRFKTYCLIIY